MTSQPLIDQKIKLQRMQGKGGWTFIVVPNIPGAKRSGGGLVRVKGFIDTYELKQYNLMPMSDGNLFLPVKSEIRKKINKREGDTVKIILFADNSPLEIPAELLMCLEDEPDAHKKFMKLTEGYQREFITWINAAKRQETKIDRIAKTIGIVMQGKTLTKR
jgi:hypothetical protein